MRVYFFATVERYIVGDDLRDALDPRLTYVNE